MLIHAFLRARGPAAAAAVLASVTACGGGDGDGVLDGQTVSGTVTMPEGTLADADTNDPATGMATNNAPGDAQDLQNPATVGGFVAAEATGEFHDGEDDPLPADRFAEEADPSDYYEANLAEGQSVTLSRMSATDANLTLHLDGETTTTTETNGTVTLSAPSQGLFSIQVAAETGFIGTYQLSIESPGSACGATDTSAAFVPGQVLVRLKESATANMSAAGGTDPVASALGMRNASRVSGRTRLWDMGNPEQAYARLRDLGLARSPLPVSRTGQAAGEVRRRHTLAVIEALKADPRIKSAMPNYIYESLASPNDNLYSSVQAEQWNLPLIGLENAWNSSTGTDSSDNPVVVAILDTGIYSGHEDLESKRSGDGYDFVGDDGDPEDTGTIFHGSHVAGIAAAATNNTTGIAGVGWDAEFMPVRVLGDSGGTVDDVIEAARYAAGLDNRSGITLNQDQRAQIINMSLGGTAGCLGDVASESFAEIRRGPDDTLGTSDDVILIAAAGNSDSSSPEFPAAYWPVISVSATDRNDALAPYSNTGPFVEVAAPGGDTSTDPENGILSTVGPAASDAGYAYYPGTSMAAPHVAGVAALMEAVYPDLGAATFQTALRQGELTEDLSGDGAAVRNDQFGYGRIDAESSVLWAESPNLQIQVAVHPEALYFEPDDSTTTLSETLFIRESAGGDLSDLGTIDVSSNQDWLTASETEPGEYEITANVSEVGDGPHQATITVTPGNGGAVEIPVLLRKGVRELDEDASVQYILLVDAGTDQAVQVRERHPSNGTYTFTFDNVSNGSYYLVSGSDINNDGFICQAWEACGIHQETVTVDNNDVRGVRFTTRFGSITTGSMPDALNAPFRIRPRHR